MREVPEGARRGRPAYFPGGHLLQPRPPQRDRVSHSTTSPAHRRTHDRHPGAAQSQRAPPRKTAVVARPNAPDTSPLARGATDTIIERRQLNKAATRRVGDEG